MKIGSFDEIITQAGSGAAKPAAVGTGKPFGEVLDAAMGETGGSEKESAAAFTVGGTAQVGFNSLSAGGETPLVDRVENFVDMLDEYRQKLGDGQYSLRDIDPLVREMETETEKLMPAFQELPDGDGLKDIMDQTLITASLEIARFNRGDYIAA
jgi:hypothetical protein